MTAIDEITRPEVPHQPTGDVYLFSRSDEPSSNIPPKVRNVFNPRFFVGGTAIVSMSWLYSYEPASNWLPFSDEGQVPTRSPGTIVTVVSGTSFSYAIEVDGYINLIPLLRDATLWLPESFAIRYPLPDSSKSATATENPTRKRKKYPAIDEANRLRDLAGVDPNTLAEIFGVTRQAYHAWQTGVAPVARHRKHILETLSAIEEAVHHFGSSRALGDWLLTPSKSSGKKPIDYLRTREYDIFRGMLLRLRSRPEFAQPLPPSRRLERELPIEHREAARRRLRPPTVIEADAKDN